jgi:hypothetical protein
MINNNQGRRQVVVDEDVLRQLIERAGLQPRTTGQYPLVPVQNNIANEFQVVDADAISDGSEGDFAPELDLNQNRNRVLDSTFGYGRN